MSADEYRKKIGIPEYHDFKSVGRSDVERKHGKDTDIYIYAELDKEGNELARYEIRDELEIYPPQHRAIRWRKL